MYFSRAGTVLAHLVTETIVQVDQHYASHEIVLTDFRSGYEPDEIVSSLKE